MLVGVLGIEMTYNVKELLLSAAPISLMFNLSEHFDLIH